MSTVVDVSPEYEVILVEDPTIVDGEPMNWAVRNKTHGTIEGTFGPLPHAMASAINSQELLNHCRNEMVKDKRSSLKSLN
jgi:hypothetical protein